MSTKSEINLEVFYCFYLTFSAFQKNLLAEREIKRQHSFAQTVFVKTFATRCCQTTFLLGLMFVAFNLKFYFWLCKCIIPSFLSPCIQLPACPAVCSSL